MVQTYQVREQCRAEAVRFGYPMVLFNRIPMHYFDYFRSEEPFAAVNVPIMTQMEIVTVFMLINNIDPAMLVEFYCAGGHDLNMLLRLMSFFNCMWRVYRATPESNLLGRFGRFYALHLETRQLRYVDMSRHHSVNRARHVERFVPNDPSWPRNRAVRERIRQGQFRVEDDYDLLLVREAMRDALFRRGRR